MFWYLRSCGNAVISKYAMQLARAIVRKYVILLENPSRPVKKGIVAAIPI
jgi:hypothetical protein